jgi:hypothetical protein
MRGGGGHRAPRRRPSPTSVKPVPVVLTGRPRPGQSAGESGALPRGHGWISLNDGPAFAARRRPVLASQRIRLAVAARVRRSRCWLAVRHLLLLDGGSALSVLGLLIVTWVRPGG